ncbi:phage tail length tape measure family protein [Duganella sp. CT11-25]|uniref:phage tail length tape measure family protein n=1 Tax=unclassified Duganella TaxID=2636909 RepID=UPI0039B0817E
MSDQIGTASIGLAIDSSGVDAGLNRMEATVERTGRSLSTLGRTGAAAVENIGTGAGSAAIRVDGATRSIQGSIQRVTAATEAGERNTRSYFESLANQRGANLNALRPYLDQLEQVRTRQQEAATAALRSGQAFNTQSQSAAQLAANLRGVPAQLTDIVTSIQGGQAPLTVFLQQGGQLRDMFGSAGGAARALGGYVLSLVSPLTIAAVAVGVLALAYNQGSKEADAFRKSIILTGNAAGTTTSQLAGMAKQASDVAGTQGANAEALAQLAGTGKVAADQLLKASITAVESQKYLVIAVEDTVKAFADLGKDPLQATLKLNDQYNYLTLATYKQIKALQDQQRMSEAAKIAQVAYADAMDSKNKQVAASLGILERAWNATGAAAKGAWDFMLNVGREDTIDDKIKRAQEALKAAQLARFSSIGTQSERNSDRDEAQRNLDRLLNIKKVGDLTAQYQAEDAKSRDAAIKFEQQGEQYLSRRAKMEKDIAAARALGQQAAQRGEDPAATEQRVQDRIAQIRQTYAALENEGIQKRIADIQRLGVIQEEQAKRDLLILQGRDEAGLNKAQDSKEAYMKAVSDADEAALTREKSRAQQRLALLAQEVVSEDGRAAQQERLANVRGEIAAKDQQILNRQAQLQKDLFVLDVQNTHTAIESFNQLYDSRRNELEAVEQQLQAQKDQNAALGLNAKQLETLNTQLVEEKANRLEVKAEILDTILGREEEAEVLRTTAQRMRELNVAQIEGVRKAANLDAYKTFWSSIDSAAQEAFTHIGEGGKSMLDRLSDSLKSGLLDLLYQLTVKQFIINVKANVSSDGFGAITSALSGGASGGGSSLFGTAANLFSVGKSIYSGFSAGIASSLGTQIAGLGNLFGSSAVSAFGTGMTLTTGQAATAAAAYGGTGTAVGGGLTAGASAASAVPIIGWIIAGMMANDSFYKQGYKIDGQRGDITKELLASTLKGNFLGPIGATATVGIGAADSLLQKLGLDGRTASLLSGSSLWAKAFGRQSPTIEGEGIRGNISSSGVTGESFIQILEKGGWFRSDKHTEQTVELNDSFKNSLLSAFLDSKTFTQGFGKTLGIDTSVLDSYSKPFDIKLTSEEERKARSDNKSQADIDAAIAKDQSTNIGNVTKFIDQISSDLAVKLIPNLADFSKYGESAGEALKRVSADFSATNTIASLLGKTATEAFGSAGLSSIAAREQFVNLSGGLDALSSKISSYSNNYLTQAEQQAPVIQSLSKAFSDLNIAAPTTRDGFKDLINGLDLTNESQVKTFNSLMDLQEAFALVTPQVDKAAQLQQQRQLDIQLMEALGNAEGSLAATRTDALAALLSDQARITQAQVYAAQDAKKAYDSLVTVANSALTGLTNSINAEKERINAAYAAQAAAIRDAAQASVDSAQASLQAAQTQVSALQTVFNALDSALSSTQIESDAATLARRRAAQGVINANVANPSNLTDNKALTDAIGTINGQGNTRLFGTFEEYARDQARTNNALAALRDAAGGQIDYAQKTVQTLEDTIEAIQKSGEAQLAQLQLNNQAELDGLDQQLANDTAQLDALKGINNSVLSLKDSMAAFAAAVAGLKANATAIDKSNDAATSSNLGASATTVEELYGAILGRHSEDDGLKFWTDALASGTSFEDIRQAFLHSDEYKKLRGFAVGTNRVPYNMPAYIHEDERIIPAADNRQLMALMARATNPGQNNAVLLDQIKRQNDLIEAQQATLAAIAANTGAAADTLDSAQKGRPFRTVQV